MFGTKLQLKHDLHDVRSKSADRPDADAADA